MKLKKEFSDFYKAIRIDTETNVLKEKREILENDIKQSCLKSLVIRILKSKKATLE